MKRSTSYTLIFGFFILLIIVNIMVLGSHHVEVEEKCEKLVLQNDSLVHTIDTLVLK